jgi:hypothetical protein
MSSKLADMGVAQCILTHVYHDAVSNDPSKVQTVLF